MMFDWCMCIVTIILGMVFMYGVCMLSDFKREITFWCMFAQLMFMLCIVVFVGIPAKENEPVPEHRVYYTTGYKDVDFVDNGVKMLLFTTINSSYSCVNTDSKYIPDYSECALKMDDNGTPDNYMDDIILNVFVDSKG